MDENNNKKHFDLANRARADTKDATNDNVIGKFKDVVKNANNIFQSIKREKL